MKLVLQEVKKSFNQKEVLRGASFTFETGKIYGLLGRNGAGKTTLFNCINEDIKTDGGAFWIEEEGERRPIAAEDIGYVLSTPVVAGVSHRGGSSSNFSWTSIIRKSPRKEASTPTLTL